MSRDFDLIKHRYTHGFYLSQVFECHEFLALMFDKKVDLIKCSPPHAFEMWYKIVHA
jgi:hypothetical protein